MEPARPLVDPLPPLGAAQRPEAGPQGGAGQVHGKADQRPAQQCREQDRGGTVPIGALTCVSLMQLVPSTLAAHQAAQDAAATA